MISKGNQFGDIILLRAEQRQVIRTHSQALDKLLDEPNAHAELTKTFYESNFFKPEPERGAFLEMQERSEGWADRENWHRARERLATLKNQYKVEMLYIAETSKYKASFTLWAEAVSDTLDELQALNVGLVRHYSQARLTRLMRTVLANVLALSVAILIVGRTVYNTYRRKLATTMRENEALTGRQEEMERLQNHLVRLAEDLSSEKEKALISAEQLQIANDVMEEKNKEMERVVYAVSHDLKAPLVTISAFTQSLARDLEEQVTEKQRHRFNRILANIGNLEGLLSDLLNLSRIIQRQFEKADVDVRPIIEKQCDMQQSEIAEINGEIKVSADLARVWGNERLLEQCVQNLISNAIKYRSPNRNLVIEVRCEVVENETHFSISDNGLGIAPEYQEKIFNIFERIGHGEGSGVGLAIVKSAMDKHGGRVELDSAEDAGCTFKLCFPMPAGEEMGEYAAD